MRQVSERAPVSHQNLPEVDRLSEGVEAYAAEMGRCATKLASLPEFLSASEAKREEWKVAEGDLVFYCPEGQEKKGGLAIPAIVVNDKERAQSEWDKPDHGELSWAGRMIKTLQANEEDPIRPRDNPLFLLPPTPIAQALLDQEAEGSERIVDISKVSNKPPYKIHIKGIYGPP